MPEPMLTFGSCKSQGAAIKPNKICPLRPEQLNLRQVLLQISINEFNVIFDISLRLLQPIFAISVGCLAGNKT